MRGCKQKKKNASKLTTCLPKCKALILTKQDQPELDIPAELARRQSRLEKIESAKKRLEERQAQMDAVSGRSLQNAQDQSQKQNQDQDPKPSGGKPKREFGVPSDKAQDRFTDPQSRIMKLR